MRNHRHQGQQLRRRPPTPWFGIALKPGPCRRLDSDKSPRGWRAKLLYLVITEVHYVGNPNLIGEPANLFEIIQWTAAEMMLAIGILVLGLAEVGV